MRISVFTVICAALLGLSACQANGNSSTPPTLPTATSVPATEPAPVTRQDYFLTATIVPFYTHVPSPTVIGTPATIVVALNMGSGGAGFSANIYAQEVYT
ncbi:MAG TPA: hypothetical protein VJ248_04140, partial [Candidatus Udaeobacter sp.]|nr:hypothetical protein [Candidatus Udaeobacter sp.]